MSEFMPKKKQKQEEWKKWMLEKFMQDNVTKVVFKVFKGSPYLYIYFYCQYDKRWYKIERIDDRQIVDIILDAIDKTLNTWVGKHEIAKEDTNDYTAYYMYSYATPDVFKQAFDSPVLVNTKPRKRRIEIYDELKRIYNNINAYLTLCVSKMPSENEE